MSTRDELIEQLAELIFDLHLTAHGKDIATALVDAGWRPPSSGDAIERATEILFVHETDCRRMQCACGHPPDGFHARHQAHALADAGFLAYSKAEVPEADDETVERVARAIMDAYAAACSVPPDFGDVGSVEDWFGEARAALRVLGKRAVEKPLPEFKCPACGATTRARMADHPYREPS
jgi:hypothetical protein